MQNNAMVKLLVFVMMTGASLGILSADKSLEEQLKELNARRDQLKTSIERESDGVYKSRLNGTRLCHSRALCSYTKNNEENTLQIDLGLVEAEMAQLRTSFLLQLFRQDEFQQHEIWRVAGCVIAGYEGVVGDNS